MEFCYYSDFKATIGFNLAAFFAGVTPNITPIKIENNMDIITTGHAI